MSRKDTIRVNVDLRGKEKKGNETNFLGLCYLLLLLTITRDDDNEDSARERER